MTEAIATTNGTDTAIATDTATQEPTMTEAIATTNDTDTATAAMQSVTYDARIRLIRHAKTHTNATATAQEWYDCERAEYDRLYSVFGVSTHRPKMHHFRAEFPLMDPARIHYGTIYSYGYVDGIDGEFN